MTKYPRAFNFRRVPAAPPRMVSRPVATHVFSFEYDDREINGSPKPWQDFLRCLGIPEERVLRIPVSTLFARWKDWADLVERKGMKLTWSHTQVPDAFQFSVVTLKIEGETSRAPRVSPKLAATFPWKMRKYLNQKP